MNFKEIKHKTCSIGLFGIIVSLLLLACDHYIVQQAASDYFPLDENNWWRYVSNSDTMLVEVEPPDTLLQTETFPVSFGGNVKYLIKNNRAIIQYIKMIYNISGDDYTIIENFIMRIELPLVTGNTFKDSLIDSLNLFGQWVKARYQTSGIVSFYEYEDSLYSGDVYKIDLVTVQQIISSDTTLIDTMSVEEYYAPNIGLIRFIDEESEYNLIEYEVQ